MIFNRGSRPKKISGSGSETIEPDDGRYVEDMEKVDYSWKRVFVLIVYFEIEKNVGCPEDRLCFHPGGFL